MNKTMQAEVYNKIEDIDQFEEMLQLADEINDVLKAYIKKNKKNKEAMEEIQELLEDYKRADLIK
jgi:hypothetical protein